MHTHCSVSDTIRAVVVVPCHCHCVIRFSLSVCATRLLASMREEGRTDDHVVVGAGIDLISRKEKRH